MKQKTKFKQTEMEKIEILKKLKNKVEKTYGKENVWFFPEYIKVKGFYGVGKIFFVGLNPSRGGKFPSPWDRFFLF